MRFTSYSNVVGACWLVTAFFGTVLYAGGDEGIEFFEQRIQPVLVERCYSCHSAKAVSKKTLKAGLLLDTREAMRKGGDSGPAVVPGRPEDSLLMAAIRKETIEMPPKGKLPDQVVADFVKWVQIGAPDPRDGRAPAGSIINLEAARRSWVYQPPKLPQRPEVSDTNWPRGDIDRLVLATLEGNGLRPATPADKRTRVRRAAYDLLGLPPSPAEVDRFVADKTPDAYQRLVDRLLKSQHFGERWGRHWLDLARYSDTQGGSVDCPIPQAYLYRDYVIDSFRSDKPYDQFIREQIAGDLLAAETPQEDFSEAIIATGFVGLSLRNGIFKHYHPELIIKDTIDTIGT